MERSALTWIRHLVWCIRHVALLHEPEFMATITGWWSRLACEKENEEGLDAIEHECCAQSVALAISCCCARCFFSINDHADVISGYVSFPNWLIINGVFIGWRFQRQQQQQQRDSSYSMICGWQQVTSQASYRTRITSTADHFQIEIETKWIPEKAN